MFYDLIPIIIIAASVIFIAVILIRKFPVLAAIDIEKIPKEQQIEVKKMLIENRLLNKLRMTQQQIETFLKPAELFLKSAVLKIGAKAKAIEEKYLDKQRIFMQDKPELVEQKIKLLFHEAEELSKSGNWAESEKKYIEIVKLDPRNIPACRNLGYIYMNQKDYPHAKEIFGYNLQLSLKQARMNEGSEDCKKQFIAAYLDLGSAHKAAGEFKKALRNFQKAVDLEPKNPRNLDLLLETSIILKEKDLAKNALKQLKEINPDNQKIEKFEEQIKNLTHNS